MGSSPAPLQIPPSPEPKPVPKVQDGLADPDAVNRARDRAAEAAARINRSKLRIPLVSTLASVGSGLQVS